jgi:hypothetical protein
VTKRGRPGRGHTGQGRKNGRQSGERFTKDAAKKQGKSERTVQREAALGEAIPDVAKLAGTSLDSPKELDALAKPSPEARGMPSRAAPKAVRGSAAIRGAVARGAGKSAEKARDRRGYPDQGRRII